MTEKALGGCVEIARDLGLTFTCCTSCHADEWEGDDLAALIEVPDGYYEVCCGASLAHKAQALRQLTPGGSTA